MKSASFKLEEIKRQMEDLKRQEKELRAQVAREEKKETENRQKRIGYLVEQKLGPLTTVDKVKAFEQMLEKIEL